MLREFFELFFKCSLQSVFPQNVSSTYGSKNKTSSLFPQKLRSFHILRPFRLTRFPPLVTVPFLVFPELCLLLFSHEVLSDSLRSHGLQHIRLSSPFLSSGICSNSCPFTQSCHPTISSCHPLFLLLSTFLSIRGFSSELALCIRWSKYWSFSFSISPSNEYLGLISFRID